MHQGERRVRSLKLRSSNDTLLLQARYRLEEAFRTATMPGLPPNAQVLIRRLDLGSIGEDLSAPLLADRISNMVHNLATAAVCVDHQSHAKADVVWFSDPLQPYIALFTTLLDGKLADEWYWRTLFPEKNLTLSEATIEMLLFESIKTPLKGLAITHLLQHALAPRRRSQLFALITPAFVSRLMHEQGLSPIPVRNVQVDGVAGGRSGVVISQRGRTIAPPRINTPWHAALQEAARCWGKADVRTLWLAWHTLIKGQPAWLGCSETLQRIDVSEWLKIWSSSVSGEEKTGPVNRVPYRVGNDIEEREKGVGGTFQTRHDADGDDILLEGENKVEYEDALIDDSLSACEAVDKQKRPSTDMETTFTSHAGFAFVVPLLQRLGIAEMLSSHERLVELDFSRHLLWMIAKRFAVAENDPVRQLFEAFEPRGNVSVERLHLPPIWWQMMTLSGRPLLHYGVMSTVSLHDLIDTTQLIVGTYLRRLCGISLRTLLCRPGRVMMTPTHWDVIFDINQTDLRLRRSALDSDPGWMTWLGKVVQFHYDSDGQRYV